MNLIVEPLHQRARILADYVQPVIVALGTAGMTGGAMAAMGMLADAALRRHRLSDD